jgi:hypothetical protein
MLADGVVGRSRKAGEGGDTLTESGGKELFCDGHHIAGAAAALTTTSHTSTRENSDGQDDSCR